MRRCHDVCFQGQEQDISTDDSLLSIFQDLTYTCQKCLREDIKVIDLAVHRQTCTLSRPKKCAECELEECDGADCVKKLKEKVEQLRNVNIIDILHTYFSSIAKEILQFVEDKQVLLPLIKKSQYDLSYEKELYYTHIDNKG